ncbi:unnamed protein product [Dovyalis caffra]|uniref:Uncharacterized protein n=1 Tax=Dovyalis caffra TaxID=77055 RepID=A0AAV1RRE6_9ROSI|nr:unnamed protein product [Dovyalis caffra]
MASFSSTVKFLLFIVFLLVVQVCSAPQLTLKRDDPLRSPPIMAFRSKPSSPRVDIEIGKITKAIWDSGFKVMSLMLERNLKVAISYQEFEAGSNSTITLYNNQAVTIFVPNDDAVRYEHYFPCQNLGYQIAASKVDKKLFSALEKNAVHGLPTFDAELGQSVYAHIASYWRSGENGELIELEEFCINNVKITNWDIYNDGHVIVHGVDGFFNRMAGHNIWLLGMKRGTMNNENNLFEDGEGLNASRTYILSLVDVARAPQSGKAGRQNCNHEVRSAVVLRNPKHEA